MKKKAIEKIPYLGLKKTSRKKGVKYICITAVKIVGHEKHLFLEVYRNKKESKDIPLMRIILTKKRFWNLYSGKRRMDKTENPDGIRLERPDLERGRRFNQLAADGKREYITRHRGSGKDKKILQGSNMERRTVVGIHIQP